MSAAAPSVSLRKGEPNGPAGASAPARVRDAGLMVLDLLIGIVILCIIMMIALSAFSTARKRHAAAAGTDSTVVTAGQSGGFEFPWAMFFSITSLLLVLVWLFAMSLINKAKAEADGEQWLKDTDPASATDADPVTGFGGESVDMAKKVAVGDTADGALDGSKSGSRRATRSGGGFLDKVGDLFDLLS